VKVPISSTKLGAVIATRKRSSRPTTGPAIICGDESEA
jgi:hypothetical protein